MSEHDVSRRDFLKRGALLGGALVWTTPVVQVVGMNPAMAQVPSPACIVWYAIKIDPSEDPACIDISNQRDPNGRGRCLDVDDLSVAPVEGGCDKVVSFTTPSDPEPWTITLDSDCELQVCVVKAGDEPCAFGPNSVCSWDPATHTVTFPNPGMPEISHVEIAFCCAD